jgi:inner-membrane-bound regulator SLS-like protein
VDDQELKAAKTAILNLIARRKDISPAVISTDNRVPKVALKVHQVRGNEDLSTTLPYRIHDVHLKRGSNKSNAISKSRINEKTIASIKSFLCAETPKATAAAKLPAQITQSSEVRPSISATFGEVIHTTPGPQLNKLFISLPKRMDKVHGFSTSVSNPLSLLDRLPLTETPNISTKIAFEFIPDPSLYNISKDSVLLPTVKSEFIITVAKSGNIETIALKRSLLSFLEDDLYVILPAGLTDMRFRKTEALILSDDIVRLIPHINSILEQVKGMDHIDDVQKNLQSFKNIHLKIPNNLFGRLTPVNERANNEDRSEDEENPDSMTNYIVATAQIRRDIGFSFREFPATFSTVDDGISETRTEFSLQSNPPTKLANRTGNLQDFLSAVVKLLGYMRTAPGGVMDLNLSGHESDQSLSGEVKGDTVKQHNHNST